MFSLLKFLSMICIFIIKGSLNDRHIANGSELYAIFTPRENLIELPPTHRQVDIRNEGPSVIRCHIMLQVLLMYDNFNIKMENLLIKKKN